MIIAKTIEGTIVQIKKFAQSVQFSDARGWFCVCVDFHKPEHKRSEVKWVPATTSFVWVREII